MISLIQSTNLKLQNMRLSDLHLTEDKTRTIEWLSACIAPQHLTSAELCSCPSLLHRKRYFSRYKITSTNLLTAQHHIRKQMPMRFYPGFAPLHRCSPFITYIVRYYKQKNCYKLTHMSQSPVRLSIVYLRSSLRLGKFAEWFNFRSLAGRPSKNCNVPNPADTYKT